MRDGMAAVGARTAETRDALAAVTALSAELRDGVAALSALLPQAVALLQSLHPKADSLGVQTAALHDKADQAGRDRAAVLAHVDALLRRNIIPAGPDVAVRTDDGYLVVPVEDEGQIAAMVETAGRLEPGTLAVACALAREGSLAVDVGTHVGTFTVPLARRVGEGGQVIAVEPTPRTAGVLRRSLALNALQERVTLHECAAGAATGRARLHLARIGSHNSLLPLDEEQEGAVEVEVRPLDDLVPPGRPCSVIKIDAEGLELDILRGAGRVLRESLREGSGAGVIAEFGPKHLLRLGVTVADWLEAFRAYSLTPWEIEEESGRLRPLREAGLGAVFSLNLLWLREPPERYPGLQRA
jgi:FkbM family methyltransferase